MPVLLEVENLPQPGAKFDLLITSICLPYLTKSPSPMTRRLFAAIPEVEMDTLNLKGQQLTSTIPGTLVLRKDGMEYRTKISHKLDPVTLPQEFSLRDGLMSATLITPDHRLIVADFVLAARLFCERIDCLFCLHALRNPQCLPHIIVYPLYGFLFILTVIMCSYLQRLFIMARLTLSLAITICYTIWRLVKGILRYSLKLGRISGIRTLRMTNHVANRINEWDETNIPTIKHSNPGLGVAPVQVLCFAILLTLALADDDFPCNTNQVVTAPMDQCGMTKNTNQCALYMNAEVTLPHLQSVACISIQHKDEHPVSLLEIAIRYDDMTCLFKTERAYYTFSTKTQVQSALECPQAEWCGWTVSCRMNDTKYPLLKPYAHLPGEQGCLPTHVSAAQCTIFHRQACLHYKAYLKPDYTSIYEVHKIQGVECAPKFTVRLTRDENIQYHTFTDLLSLVDTDNITFQYQGAFEQGDLALRDYLVFQHLEENYPPTVPPAYYTPAADPGVPFKGMIGDVQAASPRDTMFSYAPQLHTCRANGPRVQCSQPASPLLTLPTSQLRLPRVFMDHHLFLTSDRVLRSTHLSPAPVRLAIQLKGTNVSLHLQTICPEINEITLVDGTYASTVPALLKFKGRSICQPGRVRVSLANTTLLTATVYLKTVAEDYIINFHAPEKCTSTILCLNTARRNDCEPTKFCLEEPTLRNLTNPNVHTVTAIPMHQESTSWWTVITTAITGIWDSFLSYVTLPIRILLIIALILFAFGLLYTLWNRQ